MDAYNAAHMSRERLSITSRRGRSRTICKTVCYQ